MEEGVRVSGGGRAKGAEQIIKSRQFTCAVCGNTYYSKPERDAECREEFVSRYGHLPEETEDDELVSLCDWCNEEYDRLKRLMISEEK